MALEISLVDFLDGVEKFPRSETQVLFCYIVDLPQGDSHMNKLLVIFALTLLSSLSYAQECAKDINELKALVGNNGIALQWKENIKTDPLHLKLSNGPGMLRLKLTNAKGDWADVTGLICKKGANYEARVNNIVWGPAAPSAVKGRKIKSMSIKLPYHSQLTVSVRVLINFSFHFSPN